MALVLADRVQQTGTANTTVSFTLSGTVTGFQSFAVVGNGNTTYYSATDASGNWEVGIGTYATGGTLTRTTILSSSNTGAAVTFSGSVNVIVTYPSGKSVNLDASGNATALGTPASGTLTNCTFPTLNQNTTGSAGSVANALTAGTGISFSSGTTYNGSAAITISSSVTSPIPTGTVMLFYQAAAPTGWTQVTTLNDYALRIVSGTGGTTGGSVAFSTAFASQTPAGSVSTSVSAVSGSVGVSLSAGGSVSAYTLATACIPSHSHRLPNNSGSVLGSNFLSGRGFSGCVAVSEVTGGGGSHSHGFSNPTYTGSFTFSSATASSSFSGTAINLAVQYANIIIASKN